MRLILLNNIFNKQRVISRSFSCSSAVSTIEWRASNGLPINRNAEGVLTDGPDYTYLDGRPTPLLNNQKDRMLKQRGYASQIVGLCSELEFAKQRHQDLIKQKEEERQRVIGDRLKPKGALLNKKK